MVKVAVFFVTYFIYFSDVKSATVAGNYINSATYNDMQPFLNNKMRQALQTNNNSPDQTSSFYRAAIGSGNTPVSALSGTSSRRVISRNSNAATTSTNQQRRVIARSGTTTARSGVTTTSNSSVTHTSSALAKSTGRRVVARSSRGDLAVSNREPISGTTVSDTSVSASQCLSDYRSCMDGYCKRESTHYNRCYCSKKLENIETTLRPQVENILKQLVIIKNGGIPSTGMTDAELEELWQDTFYQYTGTNDMTSLNDALNIDWPDETNNMRGQNAFLIGHDYCVQHLRGCFYMISNLRDSYKSEISRDCATYETYLNNLKSAGESVISQIEE